MPDPETLASLPPRQYVIVGDAGGLVSGTEKIARFRWFIRAVGADDGVEKENGSGDRGGHRALGTKRATPSAVGESAHGPSE